MIPATHTPTDACVYYSKREVTFAGEEYTYVIVMHPKKNAVKALSYHTRQVKDDDIVQDVLRLSKAWVAEGTAPILTQLPFTPTLNTAVLPD